MQLIKDGKGNTRGWYTEIGDRKQINGKGGRNLGWYDKARDKTYNRQGAYIGNGDQTASLLED
jgi:hypothetical protein